MNGIEIDRQQLQQLLNHRRYPSVSILMPTHPAANETEQDVIRFKNHLQHARRMLTESGMKPPRADDFLRPLHDLLHDSDFWRHQRNGLAVYVNEESTRLCKVPFELDDLVMTGQHFYLKPLLLLWNDDFSFYVLTLNQQAVQLYRGDRYGLEPIDLPEAPDNLEELTQFAEPRKHLEYHSGTAPHRPGTRRPASYHGQGIGTDEAYENKRMLEFCQKVDNAVTKFLSGGRSAPLLLAASEPLIGLYRQANHYPKLVDEALHANTRQLDTETLHAKVLERMKSYSEAEKNQELDRYRQASGTRYVSDTLEDVLQAAEQRQIDTLFVSRDEHCWGHYDPQTGRPRMHDKPDIGDEDLLDRASVLAVQGGARVYPLPSEEMPDNSRVAAMLRYTT